MKKPCEDCRDYRGVLLRCEQCGKTLCSYCYHKVHCLTHDKASYVLAVLDFEEPQKKRRAKNEKK